MIRKKPELLAPAGNWKMLRAAVKAGADAVYFGVEVLNMRAKANNFTIDEIEDIVSFCHENNVDAHLTVNAIIFDDQNDSLNKILTAAQKANIDFVIGWDMAVIEKCLELEIPICISTQASISNLSAARMYKKLGAKRIVLARECTLDKIKEIKKNCDTEIETFIHGAMCVAISGRCFMSHHVFGQSANTGECLQSCRREYEIYDKSGDTTFLLGEDYVMSPKDLCTIEFINQIIDANVDSLKIEGRKRSPEYIAKTVSIYREAIDLHFEGKLDNETKQKMYIELAKVYNRGFSAGFYFGTPSGDDYTPQYGSQATTKKVYIGKVLNYYKKSKIAHIKLQSNDMKINDSIYIIGNTTGVVETKIQSLVKDEKQIESAVKGEEITFYLEELVRPRDQVYKIVSIE